MLSVLIVLFTDIRAFCLAKILEKNSVGLLINNFLFIHKSQNITLHHYRDFMHSEINENFKYVFPCGLSNHDLSHTNAVWLMLVHAQRRILGTEQTMQTIWLPLSLSWHSPIFLDSRAWRVICYKVHRCTCVTEKFDYALSRHDGSVNT